MGKAYPSTSALAFLNPGGAGPAPLSDGVSIPFAFFCGNGHFGPPPVGEPPYPNNAGWEAQSIGRDGQHMGGRWWKVGTTSVEPQDWVGQRGGAAIWDLGTLGGNGSWVNAVNDSGEAVGAARNASMDTRAFLYRGGVMQDLNSLAQNLPPGVILAEGHGINNAGQVAGDSSGTSGGYPVYHAFLYTDGEMQDLGVLPGGLDSHAYGVNDLGQVVGYSTSATGVRAFLYRGGGMYDLNDLVLNLPAGVVLACAYGINDRGQIIAQSGGSPHGYLLTPVSPQAGVDMLLLQ